ncbi:MAG: flavocytochrome c [Treponema sp.]|nr:flavocytochrome c [Treponema sp.]
MKKALVILSVLAVLLSSCGTSYKEGVYTATTAGRNGKLTVEVTFDKKGITNIAIPEHSETAIISTPAIEQVPANIVENQSLQMDTVTGASITQMAITNAVADTIKQAGGDAAKWRKAPSKAKTSAGAKIEKTVDVIVVGGGGAGLSASVAAIDAGASVILVEKTAALGGNTLLSGGVMNSADPTWQRGAKVDTGEPEELRGWMNMDRNSFPEEYRATFDVLRGQIAQYLANPTYLFDSTEFHILNTYLYGKRKGADGAEIYSDFALVQNLASNALPTVKWLSEKGIQWQATVSEPVGAMWRRGHTPSMPKGSEYAVKLGKIIEDSGNEIMLKTRATKLIMDGNKVVGIEATQSNGTPVVIHANKAVVLTTGGFGNNTKMVQQYNNYWASIPDNATTTNASGSTGDGITMALEAKAALTGMGFAQMMPVSDSKTGDLFTGLIPRFAANYIFVNKEAKRFVDEGSARDTLSIAAFAQPDGMFYMIADAEIAEEAKWLTDPEVEVANGRAFRADTLEELGKLIGLDGAALKAEMDKYNSFVDSGKDTDFGKSSFNQKVDKAPYYATPRSPAIHHTMGGLKIDTGAHVLDESGNVIPGLFAAGEVTGGIHAGNRLGGNAIADIMVYGRIAGTNATTGK